MSVLINNQKLCDQVHTFNIHIPFFITLKSSQSINILTANF
jgi:hypothetical protein